jgi:hypothetical protein
VIILLTPHFPLLTHSLTHSLSFLVVDQHGDCV